MNLYLRLIWTLLYATSQRYLSVADMMEAPSRLPMIALPGDIDLNFHINNGRLATLFDLGLIQLLGRGRMLRMLVENRIAPLIGGAVLKYRHPVGLFSRFVIETKLLGWDDKWFYCRHRLKLKDDRVAVSAISRCCLVQRGQTVRPADFTARLGFDTACPDPSALGSLFDGVNYAMDSDTAIRHTSFTLSNAA